MGKKVTAMILIVAILAGGGWWLWNRRSKAATATTKDTYIQAPVKKGDIRVAISGSGPVSSVNGVTVKANQSGTVSQILVQDGDRVKAGQVVMVIENKSLVSSLKQAQLDLQTQQANLDNLLNPLSTSVQAQRLKVESARLTLQQREEDVANLSVTALQSGVIISVGSTEGSDVNANALLFTLYDEATPTFVVGLPQAAASAVRPGMKATVELNGFGTLTGTVSQSSGAATPSSGNRDATVPVLIDLPVTAGIRPGMVGQAVLEVPGLSYQVLGNGSVKNDAVEVRAKVAGTIAQLTKKEGDRVYAGDLLAKLTNDSLTVQLAQAKNDVTVQEQNLANLVDPSRDPSDQLRTIRQKLEQAQITLSSRQSDVADLEVKAPVDGLISSFQPRVGDRITNNQALFRVADYGMMQVTIAVDELDIAKVQPGQKAEITLDALPGKSYAGQVIKINPEGIFKNDIATFDVTIGINKPEGLMAGMNATVNVVVTDRIGVLWVPAPAVRVQQGKAFVQVLENGAPVRKEVQLGIRTLDQAEVSGGLNEGDQVIVTIIKASTQGGFNFMNRGSQNPGQPQGGPGMAPGNAPANAPTTNTKTKDAKTPGR